MGQTQEIRIGLLLNSRAGFWWGEEEKKNFIPRLKYSIRREDAREVQGEDPMCRYPYGKEIASRRYKEGRRLIITQSVTGCPMRVILPNEGPSSRSGSGFLYISIYLVAPVFYGKQNAPNGQIIDKTTTERTSFAVRSLPFAALLSHPSLDKRPRLPTGGRWTVCNKLTTTSAAFLVAPRASVLENFLGRRNKASNKP